MLHNLRKRAQDEQGFTLIELLVVILIIGILAAIAIPSFLGQRSKAQDATAKTQVKSAQTAMETYFTDNSTYVGATPAALKTIEPTLDANLLKVSKTGADEYQLDYPSANTGNTFSIVRAQSGAMTRTCTIGAKGTTGGCKATADANGNKW